MSWWGKLIGGTFGFMLGGPLGALLGAALGHKFDHGMGRAGGHETLGAGDAERVQTAFFTATFSIMGHLAKADGRVSQDEITLARQVMAQMQLSPEQSQAAMHLFNEGKQPDFRLDDIVIQFRRECHRRRSLIQMFLEILIATALADGQIHTAEREVLLRVCQHLGLPRALFEQLLAMVQAQRHYAGADGAAGTYKTHTGSLDDAYGVLGVSATASDTDIKTAYRRLMNQHHPDKLVAKGLPEEMMKLATEKTQEIKAAYEQIMEARSKD